MLDIQNYGSFVSAILVFQMVPGAGTIAILSATAREGVAGGLAAVSGTIAGDFLYMLAAVAGLATVMKSHPTLFAALQWFGAGYLCWMGVRILRERAGSAEGSAESATQRRDCFRQALAVSLTNPKVVVFFVAFFPLFLRPQASPLTLVAMMAHVTVLSALYQAGLVVVGDAVTDRLRSLASFRRLAVRLAGLALIGFGVKLAVANR